eukprot:TRINITY_DN17965_c0_g1_i1.p1 TRINITY_DN17965_c0_g1~~TRINITY_DN17965_c0_g1_i1.p1  ORF type:complete len:347 (+),score=55.50 TRINITY_DN17965_c0_g1_i1:76-1041(+)
MEMQVSVPGEGGELQKQHGVLTWCFIKALEELQFDCTYTHALEEIRIQMRKIKEQHLPKMDQNVLLTFATPVSLPRDHRVLQPVANPRPADRSISGIGASMAIHAPIVVPPPAPGFIESQKTSNGAGSRGGSFNSNSFNRSNPDPHLPPPPPQPVRSASTRISSDLVHHNVEGRQGGSFAVHGASYQPKSAPRDMSRESDNPYGPSFSQREATHDSYGNMPLPAPPPQPGQSKSSPGQQNGKDLPLPPPPPPAPAARGQQPPGMNNGLQSRSQTLGLTAPNLFGNSSSFTMPGQHTAGYGQANGHAPKAGSAPWSSPLTGR